MEKRPSPETGKESQPSPESYVPDTQKIVHRHLQDKTHQITEEEMKSVKITTEHFDAEYKDLLDKAVDEEVAAPKESDLDEKIVTPWDVTK